MMLLPITAVTIATPYRRGRDEEPARHRCLEALIADLDPAIVLLVPTAAGAHRDQGDRRMIRETLLRVDREDSLSYSHRGSSDEPLLALSDAVGSAVGARGYFGRTVCESSAAGLPRRSTGLIFRSRHGDNEDFRATRRGK